MELTKGLETELGIDKKPEDPAVILLGTDKCRDTRAAYENLGKSGTIFVSSISSVEIDEEKIHLQKVLNLESVRLPVVVTADHTVHYKAEPKDMDSLLSIIYPDSNF